MLTSWFSAAFTTIALLAGCASVHEDSAPAAKTQHASAGSTAAVAAATAEDPKTKKSDGGVQKPADTKPADAKVADTKLAKADGKAKVELGKPALDFTLKDLDGHDQTLSSFRGKTVVLEWFSPACPTCQWAYKDGPFVTMPERLRKDGVVWLTINSDDPAHKSATVEANKKFAADNSMKAPLLFDPAGVVGRSYGAKTTPHMYVIDKKGVLVYRGALDNAPFGKLDGKTTEKVNYVDAALADLAAGRAVANAETRSYG